MFTRTLFLSLAAYLAHAATIVSLDGPVVFTGSFGTPQVLTAGFSTGQDYSNITISALIGGPADETFNAYLTTSIGPLATIADEVAFTTLNFPGFNPGGLTPIFTGLNLSAGTYYLTLFNPLSTSGGWSSTNAPVITAVPGSDHEFSGFFITNDMPVPYPPGSDFADLDVEEGRSLIYLVESVEEVPEPGTFALFAAGFALFAITRRR